MPRRGRGGEAEVNDRRAREAEMNNRKGGVPTSEGKPGLPADAEILLTE